MNNLNDTFSIRDNRLILLDIHSTIRLIVPKTWYIHAIQLSLWVVQVNQQILLAQIHATPLRIHRIINLSVILHHLSNLVRQFIQINLLIRRFIPHNRDLMLRSMHIRTQTMQCPLLHMLVRNGLAQPSWQQFNNHQFITR